MAAVESGPYCRSHDVKSSSGKRFMREQRVVSTYSSNMENNGYDVPNVSAAQNSHLVGCEKYIFIFIVTILALVTVANILMTVVLLYVLQFGFDGSDIFEFFTSPSLLRLKKPIVIENILKPRTSLQGIGSGAIFLSTNLSTVQMSLNNNKKISLSLSSDHISIIHNKFHVKNAVNRNISFSVLTKENQELSLPKNIHDLNVQKVTVPLIQSSKKRNLIIQSDGFGEIFGRMGVECNGGRSMVIARSEITFSAKNILFNAKNGIYLKKISSLPNSLSDSKPQNVQFKLCACQNNGNLFLVPVSSDGHGCAHANEDINPCSDENSDP